MNYFDDERKILDFFKGVEQEETALIPYDEELGNIIHTLYDDANWIYSGRKDEPPPDFYSDKYQLMMDVMRVDDHSHKVKGKLRNETNAKESQIQKELLAKGILKDYSVSDIMVNAVTDLPTYEDHNYIWYKETFERVLLEHNNKVELYRRNHPDYKIVLFVFDESSQYVESIHKIERIYEGMVFKGNPYQFLLDEDFLKVIYRLDIDYLVWFAPFKHIRAIGGEVKLPKAAIYDVRKANGIEGIRYEKDKMYSVEE